jgi:hypothetical protein
VDDVPLRDALAERGVAVDAVDWRDPAVDWAGYGLSVLRSTWDYAEHPDDFRAWARRVPRLLNPAALVEWNTDKRYLGDLAVAGVPITPTEFVAPGAGWTPAADGEWVVKPTIAGGSVEAGRYRFPAQRDLAEAHVARLTGSGRTAMIQPYLTAIDTYGETAVLFLPDADGELGFSHAIRKGAMLTGPYEGGGPRDHEGVRPVPASPAELAVAARVLAAVPGGSTDLLYARVDLIPGPDGAPLLGELELTEPSLFLRTDPASAPRMADAIVRRL